MHDPEGTLRCPHASEPRVLGGAVTCMLAKSYARQLADAQAELAELTAVLETERDIRDALEMALAARTAREVKP